MDGLLGIYARAATRPTSLEVAYTPTALRIYNRVLGTNKFTRNIVRRVTGTNQDVYVWVDSDIVQYTPSGWVKEQLARSNGEQQFAMSINATLGGSAVSDGVQTFVGGQAHGLEVLQSEPVVKMDGVTVDITQSGTVSGAALTILTVSHVYEINTTNPIIEKTTTMTFDYANGKTLMDFSIECIGTTSSLVAPNGFVPRQMYVGMDCGLRGMVNTGYIPPTQMGMDLTDLSGETNVVDGGSDCFMVGPRYGLRCRYLSGWDQPDRRAIINDNIDPDKAKIYHNVTGFGSRVVQVGEVVSGQVEWTFASASITRSNAVQGLS